MSWAALLAAFFLGFTVSVFVWVPLYIRWDEERRMSRNWVDRHRRDRAS